MIIRTYYNGGTMGQGPVPGRHRALTDALCEEIAPHTKAGLTPTEVRAALEAGEEVHTKLRIYRPETFRDC